MFSWTLVGLIGCLCMAVTDGQHPRFASSDGEPRENDATQVSGVVLDNAEPVVVESTTVVVDSEVDATTTTAATTMTTQTAEPFSCYQCTECNTKPDLTTTVCPSGVTMCFTMSRQVHNVSQVIHRGCLISNDRCAMSDPDQPGAIVQVECCKEPKCNQATQFLPAFFLFISSLVITLINSLRS